MNKKAPVITDYDGLSIGDGNIYLKCRKSMKTEGLMKLYGRKKNNGTADQREQRVYTINIFLFCIE